jgi:hypothetical protein
MRALALRALIALALTACYYGIALGIIGVLVGLPVYLAIATSKLAFVWLAVPFYIAGGSQGTPRGLARSIGDRWVLGDGAMNLHNRWGGCRRTSSTSWWCSGGPSPTRGDGVLDRRTTPSVCSPQSHCA